MPPQSLVVDECFVIHPQTAPDKPESTTESSTTPQKMLTQLVQSSPRLRLAARPAHGHIGKGVGYCCSHPIVAVSAADIVVFQLDYMLELIAAAGDCTTALPAQGCSAASHSLEVAPA